MVASFLENPIFKSYVRLPGSGSDKKAEISFCDLSRGSSLAASIVVPQPVCKPKCMTAKVASKTVISAPYMKRSRTEDETVDATELNKRRCLDNTNENVTRSTVPVESVCITPQELSNNELNKTLHKVCTNQNNERTSSENTPKLVTVPAVSTTNISNEPVKEIQTPTLFFIPSNTEDMEKLREENIQLKSENALLQKQLSLFKQLIRNPQRLEAVLQRLNERAC